MYFFGDPSFLLKILHLFLWEKAPLCTHTEKKAAYLCSRLNKSFVFLVVHTYTVSQSVLWPSEPSLAQSTVVHTKGQLISE